LTASPNATSFEGIVAWSWYIATQAAYARSCTALRIADSAGTEPRYEIISAFRSSASNETLRANGGGQAKNSQHIEGKAMDVRLKGVTTERLRDLARALKRGGVGYYPKSGFVHVDTARVRYWEG